MGVLKSTPVLPYKQGQKAEKEEEKSMLHAACGIAKTGF